MQSTPSQGKCERHDISQITTLSLLENEVQPNIFLLVDNTCLAHSGNGLGKYSATISRLVSADWIETCMRKVMPGRKRRERRAGQQRRLLHQMQGVTGTR